MRTDARELRPVLPDTFMQGHFRFEFQRDDVGDVIGFTVSSMRARRVRFERR